MTTIIGIDLGTSNSGAAVWIDGAPRIIPGVDGRPIIPSVVALAAESSDWKVGGGARQIAVESPSSAVYSIKRLIGRRFAEESVQEALRKRQILYELVEQRHRREGIAVAVGNRHLTPQEISAKILQTIKSYAEDYLDREIGQAVITVPAYFHDSQRQATRDAGRIAGLKVRRVLNEPTAACLAFGYERLSAERKTVAVYDLGGGTFDISILEVGRGPFRVRATNGDTYLGGDDFDAEVVTWVLNEIDREGRKRLRQHPSSLARLRIAAQEARVALSDRDRVPLQLSCRPDSPPETLEIDLELSRDQLETMVQSLIQRTLDPCRRALHDAHLAKSDIDEVLLVGGMTRMPAIRQAVADFFGVEPDTSINPDEVVALGAAVQAAILAGETTGLKLADVVPLSLGVRSRDGKMDKLIPRNTPIPVVIPRSYTTVCDNQESIEIAVFQGEGDSVSDNINLGSFILAGIQPASAGDPEIEVNFHADEDGILHVSARDLHTGNYKEITITDSLRLSEQEIEDMIQQGSPLDNNQFIGDLSHE